MALSNDSPFSYLWRMQWRENVFQWLREKRQYNDFDLDSCLKKVEQDPLLREAALAAFWGAYLGNEVPPVLSDSQLEKVGRLLDYGSGHSSRVEDIEDLAFVKLHLAGLLAIYLIHPDWPIAESLSVVGILEKALDAYRLAEGSGIIDEIIGDPSAWGNKYFNDDLLTFSLVMVGGIARVEMSFWRAEQRNYEEAFWDITNGAWHICATMVKGTSGEESDFKPYLPHSGRQFNIHEVADIFEEVKRHSKDIENWQYIRMGCEAIQHLGYCGLYDWLEDVRDINGETFGAIEYWGKGVTFAEDQMRIVASPIPILTRDAMERTEIKERLKRDFLRGGLWEEMDEKTWEILVDAETQWIHNRPDNMIKDFRQLLELLLPSIFPFLEHTISQRDGRLILTRMRDALLTNKFVQASIDSLKIDIRDKRWAKDELPRFLQSVIDARNYFEKDQHLAGKGSDRQRYMDKATDIHSEFLGIECKGVLPRLLRIKQTTCRKE